MLNKINIPRYEEGGDRIYYPKIKVSHRPEEYDENGFNDLVKMQEHHFWYRGRHNFLLKSLNSSLDKSANQLYGIDLGGGCGGWIQFLSRKSNKFTALAVGDSSEIALNYSSLFLPPEVTCVKIDLMNLQMNAFWDVAFLLDVIEHLTDDLGALEQAAMALRPGGLLFITVPALREFWSYNDEVAQHLRRYSVSDVDILAKKAGLIVKDMRYFNFFLSPAYYISRLGKSNLTEHEKLLEAKKAHSVPSPLINEALAGIFNLEALVSPLIKFPWGTSVMGVFQKR